MRIAEPIVESRPHRAALPNSQPRSNLQQSIDNSAVVQRLSEYQAMADRSAVVRESSQFGRVRDAVTRLSGQDLGDVAIHRDSPMPASKGALAYATRDAVHLRSGLEGALGHELWHVAQQRAGRVRATNELGDGTVINDDPALEREADRMGARAQQMAAVDGGPRSTMTRPAAKSSASTGTPIVQGLFTQREAKATVKVSGMWRSAAYEAILAEFGHWHSYVRTKSNVVKHDFLTQLLRRIDEYIASKQAKQQNDARSDRILNMQLLRANVIAELNVINPQAGEERVYVGGGQNAIDDDHLISAGLWDGVGVLGGKQTVLPGTQNALANLAEGTTIHVFGHGNLGTAIGSENDNLDPQQLVNQLIADGLSPDEPVILRLFACGTGSAPQRSTKIPRTQAPFVERVAKLLASREFQHVTVIGYAAWGMATSDPNAPLGTGRIVYSPKERIHNAASNIIPVTDREVVWVVHDGTAKQSSGGRWLMTQTGDERFEINRPRPAR
jgi:hypothetical protein